MKRMKLLLSVLVCFFSIVSAMAQHPVLKPDKDVPEFVTPKMDIIMYWMQGVILPE